MGIADEVGEALKRFGEQRIVEVFEKEVITYAKQLDMKPSEVRRDIYQHLDLKLAVVSEEAEQVIEIFNQRVRFYSDQYPLLTKETIKRVIKEYLVNKV